MFSPKFRSGDISRQKTWSYFIGLEKNRPEHGFSGDNKSGVKRNIVRSYKPTSLLSMGHELSEDRG